MRISDWSSDVCSSDLLSIFVVGNAEHGAVAHAGHARQCRLDLGGVDVHAARDDHVGRAIADEEIARLVEIAHVAGRDLARAVDRQPIRSEEHTSELQSLMRTSSAVFSLTKTYTSNF